MKHPTFVKKHNMAIRPNKNWIATKVIVSIHTPGLSPPIKADAS
jgi:hypothetical protein